MVIFNNLLIGKPPKRKVEIGKPQEMMFTINKAFFCGHFVLGKHDKKYRDSRNLTSMLPGFFHFSVPDAFLVSISMEIVCICNLVAL